MPASAKDPWDPLHTVADPRLHWSTDNVGEAMPGALTPLCWTFWRSAEKMTREIGYQMGLFSRAERRVPADQSEWNLTVFYGRGAARVEYLASIGDRMPGTSGVEVVRSVVGTVPDTFVPAPTRRRYPILAWRFPLAFTRVPRQVRTLAVETDEWWLARQSGASELDEAAAVALMREAEHRFEVTLIAHSVCVFAVVQPLYEVLRKLVERTGRGDIGELSGSGGAEMAIIGDIWRASRGEIGLDDVVAGHGFHGPREGEISSLVWREDPSPLRRMIDDYAARPDSDDPIRRVEDDARRLPAAQDELLAALPRLQRGPVRGLLRLAAARIPLRGVGKRSFLQALDVGRAAARRLGELLTARGVLDDPQDVFYLTFTELTDGLPSEVRDLVARRKKRYDEYRRLTIPASWRGAPEPTPVELDPAPADGDVITGVGVSRGTVEGTVRVVTDPSFAEVEADEVLVAPTTDPSWASIMFLSSALVVDIGGAMSHAAVVARELGLPCVVNTRSGTRALHTGDRVRVDGTAGTVHVLQRARVDPVVLQPISPTEPIVEKLT